MRNLIRICSTTLRRGVLPAAISSIAIAGWAGGGVIQPVDVSGQHVIAANGNGQGLSIINGDNGAATAISAANTASYGATISPDGGTVCYKSFDAAGNQSPTLYDIASGTERILATAPQAGTPAVAANGAIAYTVANQLFVIPPGATSPTSYDLGYYVNLISISPKADRVAFNDENDQIVIMNLSDGERTIVTDGKQIYFAPSFSPNGKKLLVRSLAGDVFTVKLKTGKFRNIGPGEAPSWLNNKKIALTRKTIVEGVGVEKTEVLSVNTVGKVKAVLSETPGDAFAAAGDSNFIVAAQSLETAESGATAVSGIVRGKGVVAAPLEIQVLEAAPVATAEAVGGSGSPDNVYENSSVVRLTNVPYIHQNDDAPDWWNGNWSCNVTAALMGIQYYNILPKHPISVSWPTPHTSDYGWYIPNVYSKGGQTFNIGSSGPWGNTGYGGYGYITQNGWEDTKTHMAEYISFHGPSSSVDWSPTISEARAEIDDNHPFVILVSITSSGHYPLCIGYVKNQHTLIFNDPYGNKNTGSYPSPDGRNVRYDWPGYNNGYSNLVTVHCFIYCRFGQPSAPSNVSASASGSTINLSWQDNSWCESNYDVRRSTTAGGPYTTIASLGANATSYSNKNLAGNTTYYYVVRARNPSGSSPNSNQASATTGGGASTIIVDNTSADFSASGNWSTSSYASEKYGSNYRFRSTQAVSDSAVWDFNITSAGSYKIYAWWSDGTNRSSSASYFLPGGTKVVKDQQSNGGSWQLLGTKTLSTGTHSVSLSCWSTAGYVVIADAIKVVPQ